MTGSMADTGPTSSTGRLEAMFSTASTEPMTFTAGPESTSFTGEPEAMISTGEPEEIESSAAPAPMTSMGSRVRPAGRRQRRRHLLFHARHLGTDTRDGGRDHRLERRLRRDRHARHGQLLQLWRSRHDGDVHCRGGQRGCRAGSRTRASSMCSSTIPTSTKAS